MTAILWMLAGAAVLVVVVIVAAILIPLFWPNLFWSR